MSDKHHTANEFPLSLFLSLSLWLYKWFKNSTRDGAAYFKWHHKSQKVKWNIQGYCERARCWVDQMTGVHAGLCCGFRWDSNGACYSVSRTSPLSFAVMYSAIKEEAKENRGRKWNPSQGCGFCSRKAALRLNRRAGSLSSIQFTPSHKHSQRLVVISCETSGKNKTQSGTAPTAAARCKSHEGSSDISFLPNISLLIDQWEKVACETSLPVSWCITLTVCCAASGTYTVLHFVRYNSCVLVKVGD